MLDLIIKNGIVVDGTGAPAFKGDVGVLNGKIAFVGDSTGKEAKEIFDAAGRYVTPGFIDMHSHADTTMSFYPEMTSFLMQGVTTFVGGQCGSSPAPRDKQWMSLFADRELVLKKSGKMLGASPFDVERDEMFKALSERYGREYNWNTMAEYFAFIRKLGFGVNYCALAGHSTIRGQVMGKGRRRTATDDEIKQMQEYLHECMKAGCRGVSFGLDYDPGVFADYRELKAMAEVVAQYGGMVQAHWRKTGLREKTPRKQRKIDGIEEILRIGLETGVQVELSHLIPGFDSFPVDDTVMIAAAYRTLEIIQSYRDKGVKVFFDIIPNITGGTLLTVDLVNLYLQWAAPCGSVEQFVKNLRYPDYRESIYKVINSGAYYTINPVANPEWSDFIEIIGHKNPDVVGKSISQIAAERGKSDLDTAFDLLMEDPETKIFQVIQNLNMPANMVLLNDEHATVGLDTMAVDLEYEYYQADGLPCVYANPNTYCGFIRYLTLLKQDTIEKTINKVTGKPAEILGYADRGTLTEGKAADIVVFDENNLVTNENHFDPRVYPEGIDAVWVNGVQAIKDGAPTNSLSGQILTEWVK